MYIVKIHACIGESTQSKIRALFGQACEDQTALAAGSLQNIFSNDPLLAIVYILTGKIGST
jgi:hypothetical protein